MNGIYERIHDQFRTYVRGFYSEDDFLQRNIILKEEHTHRVVEEARRLSEHLGLSRQQRRVVAVSALLHDIARFPQITRYRSFKDRVTRDHGDWGYEILSREGFLDTLAEEEQRQVLTAVRLHNKFMLPDELDDATLLYCRVLRDADKIDILHVVTSMAVTEEGVQAEGSPAESVPEGSSAASTREGRYNPLLVENLLANEYADYRQVHNTTDMYLLQLSWLYSFNYPYSLAEVAGRGLVDKLLAKLPEDTVMKQVRRHIHGFCSLR